MSPDDADALENDLINWMEQCDENLSRQDGGQAADEAVTPADDEQRQRLRACMRLLHFVLPAPTAKQLVLTVGDLPPASADVPPTRFGRFLIHRELGRGGFGMVFLAEDTHLNRPVALKLPHANVLSNPELRERFLREARAAARLNHPNIVPVHEAGAIGPVCYIVSGYCPGENLAVWLKSRQEPLSPQTAAALTAVLADAVQHAHDHGILHRDLKPSNILMEPRRAGLRERPEYCTRGAHATPLAEEELPFLPRLTDFGLAKLLEAEDEQTSSGVVLGTPLYMAPEQAEGWAHAVGAPTDVYALGVILYELLTRQIPCQGSTLLLTLERVRSQEPAPPSCWRADVPADLETTCLKCLQKEPRQRYTTAGELAEDLRRFGRDEPIHGRRPGLLMRIGRWCRAPERIRDAAVMGFFNGFVMACACSLGLLLALVGVFPVERWGPALVLLLSAIALGCIILWISWHSAARNCRVLWAGVFVPWLFPSYQLASIPHLIDTGLTNYQDRSVLLAQTATITLLALLDIAAYSLAVAAYYANRHRPGFVPQVTPSLSRGLSTPGSASDRRPPLG